MKQPPRQLRLALPEILAQAQATEQALVMQVAVPTDTKDMEEAEIETEGVGVEGGGETEVACAAEVGVVVGEVEGRRSITTDKTMHPRTNQLAVRQHDRYLPLHSPLRAPPGRLDTPCLRSPCTPRTDTTNQILTPNPKISIKTRTLRLGTTATYRLIFLR